MSVINEVTTIAVKELVVLVKKSYAKRPTQTLIAIIGVLISISSLIFSISYLDKQQSKSVQVTDIGIQDRLKKLNDVQYSLKELGQFIEAQKQSMVNENKLLESLKEEKKELEPIVKANRELVDKIFEHQEKRNKWEFGLSIGLGFLLGIVASFLGSILYSSYRKYKLKKASA